MWNYILSMAPLDLSLTHGQVAWALARGQQPSDQLIDQLRYLRQLGVPFSKHELGGGRGNRIRYGFDQLIELGPHYADRHRCFPKKHRRASA